MVLYSIVLVSVTKYFYSECMQGECHYSECQNTNYNVISQV
jgi:hypothetical protein